MARKIKPPEVAPDYPAPPEYGVIRYVSTERVDFDDLTPGDLFVTTEPSAHFRDGNTPRTQIQTLADPGRRTYYKHIKVKWGKNTYRGWWDEPELYNEIYPVKRLNGERAGNTLTYWVYRVELIEACPPPVINYEVELGALRSAVDQVFPQGVAWADD